MTSLREKSAFRQAANFVTERHRRDLEGTDVRRAATLPLEPQPLPRQNMTICAAHGQGAQLPHMLNE
jgi:hypothetical protein